MRATLVLLVVVAALYFALIGTRNDGSTDVDRPVSAVLEGRRVVAAERIEVQRSLDYESVVLERGDAGWRVVEPVVDIASDSVLEALGAVFDSAQSIRAYADDEVTDDLLAQCGLAPPQSRVTFTFADRSEPIVLEIGLEGPLGSDLFARRGDEILRIDKSLQSALRAHVDEYRDPFVFRNVESQVQRFRLERRVGQDYEVLEMLRQTGRGGGQLYELVRPTSFRLDQNVARSMINLVLSMRIDAFVAGAAAEPLEGPPPAPELVVEVDGVFGTERLEVAATEGGGLVGSIRPRDVTFGAKIENFSRLFEIPLQQLRARWLFAFPIDDAGKIEIDHGDTVVTLERTEFGSGANATYRLTGPVDFEADPTAVNLLLQGFRNTGVVAFVEDGAESVERYGLAPDQRPTVVKLTNTLKRQTQELWVGRTDGDQTYARLGDEPHVVAIPAAAAQRFRAKWVDYVGKSFFRINGHARLTRLVATRDGDARGEITFAKDADGVWRNAAGEESDVAAEAVDELREFAAAHAVDLREVGELDAPWELAFTAANGDELNRLEVWLRGDKDVLARRSGQQLLWQLKSSHARMLRELLPSAN